VVLEPVMKLEVESPGEFQGAILKTVMQRRGTVIGTTEEDGFCRLEAEVPLAEMFGYATDLRSSTQGKAEFSMEFSRYLRVPAEVQSDLIKQYGESVAKDDDE
jgi:elongation factor G